MGKTLLIALAIIWFIGSSWLYNKYHCGAGVAKSSTLTMADGDWNYSSDNLKFGQASGIPVLDLSSSNAMDSLSAHCALQTPTPMVNVSANYYASETNSTEYENLGKARAEAVKADLISRGMDAGNIFTSGNLLEGDFKGDTLFNGIAVDIQQLKDGELVVLDENNLLQPRNVYFETGKNSLSVTAELANYMENAKQYLKENPERKMYCTGYTDNVGAPAMNESLSAERALFVKSQLEKKEFEANQIETLGKGPADPIADNNTEEGRAQNRRVEMRIK